jgi:hypothetical protein
MILLWRENWFVTQKGGNRLSVLEKKFLRKKCEPKKEAASEA